MKGLHSRPLVAVRGSKFVVICAASLAAAASAVIIKTQCGGQLNALGSDALRVTVTPRLGSGFYVARPSDLSRCRLCAGTHHVMFSIISDYFTAPLAISEISSFLSFRLYVKETHTTSSHALTLFPCTCRPALLHGQMHSTPNTEHSAQQHLIQDLTHNQPWGGKTAGGWGGVVWLGESGGWGMVFIDIASRGM